MCLASEGAGIVSVEGTDWEGKGNQVIISGILQCNFSIFFFLSFFFLLVQYKIEYVLLGVPQWLRSHSPIKGTQGWVCLTYDLWTRVWALGVVGCLCRIHLIWFHLIHMFKDNLSRLGYQNLEKWIKRKNNKFNSEILKKFDNLSFKLQNPTVHPSQINLINNNSNTKTITTPLPGSIYIKLHGHYRAQYIKCRYWAQLQCQQYLLNDKINKFTHFLWN